jgi:hypothetical protein
MIILATISAYVLFGTFNVLANLSARDNALSKHFDSFMKISALAYLAAKFLFWPASIGKSEIMIKEEDFSILVDKNGFIEIKAIKRSDP